ncbi:MAG: hypothetical protein JWQ16_624 [Novosphingobium sp.]|nr:hypothetical protein [Novosphingobium sp.]
MSVEPAPTQFRTVAGRSWRGLWSRQVHPIEGAALGLILTLLSALPILVAKLPQMGDYAAHLARYRVMLDGGRSPFLTRYYSFEWKWTGNVGFDLLIGWVSPFLGLEPAGRLLIILIPILTGLGILAAEWALRRRIGIGSMLAMTFIWTPALIMGFVNFALSMAAALLAFALWIELRHKRWRWVPFLPIGVIVWACHVSGWGILGIMVFGYEWSQRKSWRAFVAPWPLLLPVGPLLFGGGTKGILTYGANVLLYKEAIWKRAMRDQVFWLDMATPLIAGAAILAALFRRKIDGRLGWAVVLLVVASFAVPRRIVGGDYADYRLIATAFLLGCLAIEWRPPRLILWLAPALFLVRLGYTTTAWAEGSRQMEAILTTLDYLPQGAKVASAVGLERGDWPNNSFDHLSGYAVVRKDALTNTNFAIPTIHMLQVREGGHAFADPTQRLNYRPGEPLDLSEFAPARMADYLWYIGKAEPAALPPGAEVIYRTPGSLLARLTTPRHLAIPRRRR